MMSHNTSWPRSAVKFEVKFLWILQYVRRTDIYGTINMIRFWRISILLFQVYLLPVTIMTVINRTLPQCYRILKSEEVDFFSLNSSSSNNSSSFNQWTRSNTLSLLLFKKVKSIIIEIVKLSFRRFFLTFMDLWSLKL